MHSIYFILTTVFLFTFICCRYTFLIASAFSTWSFIKEVREQQTRTIPIRPLTLSINGNSWYRSVFQNQSVKRPCNHPSGRLCNISSIFNDTSSMFWCVVILENVVVRWKCWATTGHKWLSRKSMYFSAIILLWTLHKVPGQCCPC